MEKLIQPDFGLIFWTLLNFALLVLLLGKFGWKPVLRALQDRENRIKADVKAAQEAREATEKMKAELDAQLKSLAERTQSALAQAAALGEKEKNSIVAEAQRQAQEVADASRRAMEAERAKLIAELRSEVAGLSIAAAEKLLAREIDRNAGKTAVEQFLRDIEAKK
jgi:F-type H+-transporting ATPase subunit b